MSILPTSAMQLSTKREHISRFFPEPHISSTPKKLERFQWRYFDSNWWLWYIRHDTGLAHWGLFYSCDMHSIRKNISYIVPHNGVWVPMKISHLYYNFRLLTVYSAIIYFSWLIQSSPLPFFLPALDHFRLLCLSAKFSLIQNGVFYSKLHKVNMCCFTCVYTT